MFIILIININTSLHSTTLYYPHRRYVLVTHANNILVSNRFSPIRVEYSEWYKQDFAAPITGSYLLRQTQKLKLSKQELAGRDYMEM